MWDLSRCFPPYIRPCTSTMRYVNGEWDVAADDAAAAFAAADKN